VHRIHHCTSPAWSANSKLYTSSERPSSSVVIGTSYLKSSIGTDCVLIDKQRTDLFIYGHRKADLPSGCSRHSRAGLLFEELYVLGHSSLHAACLISFFCLAHSLQPRRWRRHAAPKLRLTINELHIDTTQKREHLIATTVKTSNPVI
jgi:hypothetical protein